MSHVEWQNDSLTQHSVRFVNPNNMMHFRSLNFGEMMKKDETLKREPIQAHEENAVLFCFFALFCYLLIFC